MKIRAQLVLALFLLAVLPLTGLVLYSYLASTRAVRQTVEQEAQTLTADMEQRLGTLRGDLERRVASLGRLPLHELLAAPTDAERDAVIGRMLFEMGDAAPLVDSFEFVPIPDANVPPHPHQPPLPPEAPQPTDPEAQPMPAPAVEAIVLRVTEELRERQRELEEKLSDPELGLAEGVRFGLELAAVVAEAVGQSGDGQVENGRRPAEREEEIARWEQEVEAWAAEQERRAAREERQAERIETTSDRTRMRFLRGRGFDVEVRDSGRVVGQVTTRISAEEILHRLLGRTRRDQGEIPFARDADGELYVADEADRELLERLDLEQSGVTDEAVIVTKSDPESGLIFGIVRPIRESLAEIKRTAGRNLAYGIGLIGLALLGILPLSRRMTRNLHVLTEGAEKIAGGDLTTRLPVRSRDEFGHLARTFNDMAHDLERHQERIVEEERVRRDQEVERQLLEAEYQRKTRELEEARDFQLSLLPKNLPQHPAFELAVHMQTANEVGGDYYDFHLADNGTLTIAVGDATGHGARAGTMVTAVKSLFSAYASGSGLSRFLIGANRTIRRMDLDRMAMTLTVAELRRGILTVSAAGMPPALVHRRATGEVEEIAMAGLPLGSLEFDYREERREVAAGGTVLLMSDGLPELVSRDGEVLGYTRARELFAGSAHKTPREIVADLAAAAVTWTDGGPPNDDVTFVVLRVRAAGR